MEDHICSHETAKKLHDKGVKCCSKYSWVEHEGKSALMETKDIKDCDECYPALTLEECKLIIKKCHKKVSWHKQDNTIHIEVAGIVNLTIDKNEADKTVETDCEIVIISILHLIECEEIDCDFINCILKKCTGFCWEKKDHDDKKDDDHGDDKKDDGHKHDDDDDHKHHDRCCKEVKELIMCLIEEIKCLRGEINELRKEVSCLRKEVAELKEEIKHLRKEVEELKEIIKGLHELIEWLIKEIKELIEKCCHHHHHGHHDHHHHDKDCHVMPPPHHHDPCNDTTERLIKISGQLELVLHKLCQHRH